MASKGAWGGFGSDGVFLEGFATEIPLISLLPIFWRGFDVANFPARFCDEVSGEVLTLQIFRRGFVMRFPVIFQETHQKNFQVKTGLGPPPEYFKIMV